MAKPQVDSLHDPLHEPLHDPANFAAMTDEEILAYLSNQTEADKFAIPRGLEPDGMKYQWLSAEILGKPNYKRLSEATMNGWQPVPAKRHDGLYMPPGSDGPIIVDGMSLYELPERVYRLKRELAARVAHNKVQDMNNQLIYAPPGTAPRDAHPKTKPVVNSGRAVTELMVE